MASGTTTSNSIIVSYASRGREDYPSVLPRLVETARAAGYDGDFLLVAPDKPAGELFAGAQNNLSLLPFLPAHDVVPYGFKPGLIDLAAYRGYKRVIWFDSTIQLLDWKRFKEKIDTGSVTLFDNPGCPESHWTSDDCLAQLDCAPQVADMFSQVMACAMAFNFISDDKDQEATAWDVLADWLKFSKDGISFQGRSGSTRPEYRAHRHDQSVISFLAYSYGLDVEPYGFLAYWDDRHTQFSALCNRGIGQP